MEQNQFSRMQILINDDSMSRIKNSHVIIFGLGGVGGYAAESLARCGIGKFTLVDKDTIDITNLNRQIVALHSTIGKLKIEIMKNRIIDINPSALVHKLKIFYDKESCIKIDLSNYSYVVDAIDTVASKILLIENAKKAKVSIISSMGTGNKIDPTMFEVSDIYKTSVCPLARVMRRELKKRKIKDLKVIYSKEKTISTYIKKSSDEKISPGSFSFVPPVAGMILSGEVVKDIISI